MSTYVLCRQKVPPASTSTARMTYVDICQLSNICRLSVDMGYIDICQLSNICRLSVDIGYVDICGLSVLTVYTWYIYTCSMWPGGGWDYIYADVVLLGYGGGPDLKKNNKFAWLD